MEQLFMVLCCVFHFFSLVVSTIECCFHFFFLCFAWDSEEVVNSPNKNCCHQWKKENFWRCIPLFSVESSCCSFSFHVFLSYFISSNPWPYSPVCFFFSFSPRSLESKWKFRCRRTFVVPSSRDVHRFFCWWKTHTHTHSHKDYNRKERRRNWKKIVARVFFFFSSDFFSIERKYHRNLFFLFASPP